MTKHTQSSGSQEGGKREAGWGREAGGRREGCDRSHDGTHCNAVAATAPERTSTQTPIIFHAMGTPLFVNISGAAKGRRKSVVMIRSKIDLKE